MPELPEVETIKEAMRCAIEGARVISVVVFQRRLRTTIPDEFENIVCGAKILRIYRVAKYAIMQLDNGYSVIWHFGMSGKIKFYPETNPKCEKHDHVVLKTSKGTLVYHDPRRFGLVTVSRSEELEESALFNHLGIDPFSPKLTVEYLARLLRNKKTPIKQALLDQSIVCGIGNIYASEALYKSGISPLRNSSSLKKTEINRLIIAIRGVLQDAIQAGGSTLHDYRKPDGSTGYFQLQHAVYGRDGQCCPNCVCGKNNITKIFQAGRSTYYCPHRQK
ncbi:MAG: bifunctional DNA-formamidopyrimidine glycosylase/DNA-(apurinic or apyrimidinic site) lyase [Alphaproteobacteria bacterium]|nr:bifunctional DNA-formamidopyrimidine glycosylase/DNA-(apurinic or apyrimidinic site) lyase [Alphaproteobacteria bacterium]